MKPIKLVLAALLLITTQQAFSKVNGPLLRTDTLQKTNQYLLFSKGENIDNVRFSRNKKSKDETLFINIDYAKTSSGSGVNQTGVQSPRQFGNADNPTISNVRIILGKYTDMKADAVTKTATLYTLSGLQFPLRLQVFVMGEIIDFELSEPGRWNVDLILKK